MNGLRAELARVGIRGRLAARIEAELDDHLACNPSAEMGSPREIAERFAAELRLPKARRATYVAFGALALVAAVLVFAAPGGGVGSGLAVAIAGLAIAVAAQFAFAAGVLAMWGVRTRASLAVVRQRVVVALAAGAVVVGAGTVDAVVGHRWAMLAMLAPLPLFAVSLRDLRIDPGTGAATRGFARAEAAALGALVVAAMTLGSTVAEHSWFEGVSRGAVEAIAFAGGYLVLGRRLGIRR